MEHAASRQSLQAEWIRNEAELERLRLLPVGIFDPATREAELEKRQDEIGFLLGDQDLRERRRSSP